MSSHRVLFGRLLKDSVVGYGDVLLRITLAMLSLLLVGVVFFLFDVVTSRPAAMVAGGIVLAVVIGLWLVVPIMTRAQAEHDRAEGN